MHSESEPRHRSEREIGKKSPTDVSLVASGILAGILTTVFYAFVVSALRENYLGQLLGSRGWVPYAITFLAFWAIVKLSIKCFKLSRQTRTLKLELLPEEMSEQITRDNAHAFCRQVEGVVKKPSTSILAHRIIMTLEHFEARGDVQEAYQQLKTQADTDANAIESSYSMLKVFIWAIPILGFIGTVLGIGQAVGGFSASVEAAQSLEVLKESLGSVTLGLGVAFDTTLLALVVSVVIMFPASSLQKAEEDFLLQVEQYCNSRLLCRLDDGHVEPEVEPEVVIRQAIAEEMAKHHVSLQVWTERLESVGKKITEHVVAGWKGIHDELRATQGQIVGTLTTSSRDFSVRADSIQTEMLERWNKEASMLRQISQEICSAQNEVVEKEKAHIEVLSTAMDRFASCVAQEQEHMESVRKQAAEDRIGLREQFLDQIRQVHQEMTSSQQASNGAMGGMIDKLTVTLDSLQSCTEANQEKLAHHLEKERTLLEEELARLRQQDTESQQDSLRVISGIGEDLGQVVGHFREQTMLLQEHVNENLTRQQDQFKRNMEDLHRKEAELRRMHAEIIPRAVDRLTSTLALIEEHSETAQSELRQTLQEVAPTLGKQLASIADAMAQPLKDHVAQMERLFAGISEGTALLDKKSASFSVEIASLHDRVVHLSQILDHISHKVGHVPPSEAKDSALWVILNRVFGGKRKVDQG